MATAATSSTQYYTRDGMIARVNTDSKVEVRSLANGEWKRVTDLRLAMSILNGGHAITEAAAEELFARFKAKVTPHTPQPAPALRPAELRRVLTA